MIRIFLAVLLVFLVSTAQAQEKPLKGSKPSMRRQNAEMQKADYTLLATSADVRRFAGMGLLLPLEKKTDTYFLDGPSFEYARREVKVFIERLSRQYNRACGYKLGVTSLTRPGSHQPQNASELSVHPAGMAVDMRVSSRKSCRVWLEATLVSLEKKGLIEATRERWPAHYHVAVFPKYLDYVAKLQRLAQK